MREAIGVVLLVVVAAIASGRFWFWVSLLIGLLCAIVIAILELRLAKRKMRPATKAE
jgi:uncharacterized membrane-anchored protein YhcB (DUF1043 family)